MTYKYTEDQHDICGINLGIGTDSLTLFSAKPNRTFVNVREIGKAGRKAVDSNEMFIDGLPIPADDMTRTEGQGFRQTLYGRNPERILVAAEGAEERHVFWPSEQPEPGHSTPVGKILNAGRGGDPGGDARSPTLRFGRPLRVRGQRHQAAERQGLPPRSVGSRGAFIPCRTDHSPYAEAIHRCKDT